MDITLFIIGTMLIAFGLLGCIFPIIPGPPLAYAAMICLHFTSYAHYSLSYFFVIGIFVVGVTLLDNFVPIFGSKAFGVSKRGMWGSFIGMIVGMIVFPPFGAVPGIIIGAIVGEYASGKKHLDALRSGAVTFILTLFMLCAKLAVSGWIAYDFFMASFGHYIPSIRLLFEKISLN